jgi:N-acyl-D-amino-acid deacylase
LEEKVRRLTFLPARFFGLEGRGLIAPGYFGDLLVVKSSGEGESVLEYVFVNGKPVLKNGCLTKIRPGIALRS